MIDTVFFALDGTLLPMDLEVFVKDYLGRIAAKLAPHGYDPKQLHHMYRLKEFLIRFLSGDPFDKAMIPRDINTLLAIKRGSMNYDEALAAAEEMNTWALNFMDNAKYTPFPIFKEVDEFLDEIAYDIIRSEVNGSSRL